ncbi:hypothetical protein DNTS_026928 [Danionella cerebrum]|uniref:Uncharacterized protein n=1 Tax=Danionella cerebrum TaxID=2873325 RepID=A0A553QJU0_9TELE|nr:hypothetical protein DNTS_026928 [Danionella translucida]
MTEGPASFELQQSGTEPAAPTDLHQTATELADWLLLIQQMLKSSIVTIGDSQEIHTTMSRLQVTKGDLEQRHFQLEEIITLAQNIKNKTSSPDLLEKVRGQWDGTQHGVEARLLELQQMIGRSEHWEEQRQKIKGLIGQHEMRFNSLLQQSGEPLTKQISDNKVFRQDLSGAQESISAFTDLSNQLLSDYITDDTRRLTEQTDALNTAWNSLNHRASDLRAALDSEFKSLQTSLRELESFLKWLQETESTVSVVSDSAQREGLSQDSARIRKLKAQLGKQITEIH